MIFRWCEIESSHSSIFSEDTPCTLVDRNFPAKLHRLMSQKTVILNTISISRLYVQLCKRSTLIQRKHRCVKVKRSGCCERENNPLPFPRSEIRYLSYSVHNLVANFLSYFLSNRFTFRYVSAYFYSAENASTSLYKYTIKNVFLMCWRGQTQSTLYSGLQWAYFSNSGSYCWWW
jgi:hypothetical protein